MTTAKAQKMGNSIYFQSTGYFTLHPKGSSVLIKSMQSGLSADPTLWKLECKQNNGNLAALKWNAQESAWEYIGSQQGSRTVYVSKRLSNVNYSPLFSFDL